MSVTQNERSLSDFPTLTVIIPVYNEAGTIASVVDAMERDLIAKTACEVIIVDDGSGDGTRAILDQVSSGSIQCVHLQSNSGKTVAVRKGLELATGNWVIVQDADLEYSPGDILRLLDESDGQRVAVFGRRPSYWHKPSRWAFVIGVLTIDCWMWLIYRRWVRDHATCYKLVPREILETMNLQSTGFEGCVEITSKLMRMGIPIRQVPVEYNPRPVSAGKKLKPTYFFTAMAAVWRWRRWIPGEEKH